MNNNQPLYNFRIFRSETREDLGKRACADAVDVIKELLSKKAQLRIIFAAAPSQNEFLEALAASDVDFSRIIAFHMDEYVGLPADSTATFRTYLKNHIFDLAPFGEVHYINSATEDIDSECERYAALLSEAPIDIVFMGIGENGHIAFNDPGEANFNDPYLVRRVKLDDVCRMQQVHDGCFPNLDAVPQYAITLTVPMLQSASHHFCMVPAALKAEAVRHTVYDEISPDCPATVMRLCKDARLYLDKDSSKLL